MYTSIKINGIVVSKYLDSYDVQIKEKYANSPNFTAISGKEVKSYLGDRRTLAVNFEPMETSQINELFTAIKSVREDIPIEYIDPQMGVVTKKFNCPNLPAATYFVSDDGRQFWTIPTVNFEETDTDFADSGLGGGWEYILELGGIHYGNDEISQDLSISVSGSSDGFAIGQCTSCSISGTVQYKHNALGKNGLITLYRKHSEDNLEIIYQWYIASYTTDGKTEINFTGNDVMAFAENSYLSEIPKSMIPPSGTAKITISNQIQVAQQIISRLTNSEITIQMPNSSSYETEYSSGWSIRQLLGYAAVWGAKNYSVKILGYEKAQITYSNIQYFGVNSDDFSQLKMGVEGNKVNCVKIGRTDNFDPAMRPGQTLEDYWIYSFYGNSPPTPAGTMEIVCPYVDDTVKTNSAISSLIEHDFGTEFSCENVRVDKILPAYTQIGFEGYNQTFYISNATYKLTPMGIFASINGGTKSLSDFEFIGKTEKALKSKIALDTNYGNMRISLDKGAHWTDEGVEVDKTKEDD